MNRILGNAMAGLVGLYQKHISPLTPPSCRFYPCCSEYSRIAFLRHGFFTGIWLTVWRLMRCNPWNPGGYDPVPLKSGNSSETETEKEKGGQITDGE